MRPRRLGRAFRAASGNRLEDRSVLGVFLSTSMVGNTRGPFDGSGLAI
jgi:hypothetical protein